MDYDRMIERLTADSKDWAGDGYIKRDLMDAATAIETLRADLSRVTAERDEAVSDLELFATCDTCKFGEMKMAYDCLGCDHTSNWKWRGIKKED